MSLLSDAELKTMQEGGLLTVDSRIVARAPEPASMDLTIGSIYLPTDSDKLALPRRLHSLEQGETAAIITAETITLPMNVAGITFPPSRVAFRGLLVTNPGHIDPGWSGPLRFMVINMGREPYELQQGNPIATVLLFKMATPATKGWKDVHEAGNAADLVQSQVASMSSDFLNITDRARAEARTVANRQSVKSALWIGGAFLIPILFMVGAAVLSTESWPPATRSAVWELRDHVADNADKARAEIDSIREQLKGEPSRAELDSLEKQVGDLKSTIDKLSASLSTQAAPKR